MKIVVLILLLTVVISGASASSLPSAAQIIQKEGQLAFSDGSSFYLFNKDGTFRSGPIDGLSGRTIRGRWKAQSSGGIVILGLWGWVNGYQSLNDYRRITMFITPLSSGPRKEGRFQEKDGVVLETLPRLPDKMYQCYFVVDELVKVPPPKK